LEGKHRDHNNTRGRGKREEREGGKGKKKPLRGRRNFRNWAPSKGILGGRDSSMLVERGEGSIAFRLGTIGGGETLNKGLKKCLSRGFGQGGVLN